MIAIKLPTPFLGPVIFCWMTAHLFAGTNGHLHFEHLSMEDGLSQSVINGITQDSYGFLWISTQDGLNRWDGYTFKVFKNNPNDPNSISNNYCFNLLAGEQGELWIGTFGGGLNHYVPGKGFQVYRHDPEDPNSLPEDNVISAAFDASGRIWIGTLSSGMVILDPSTGQLEHLDQAPGEKAPHGSRIWDFQADPGGNMWVSSNEGLSFWDRKRKAFSAIDLGLEPGQEAQTRDLLLEGDRLWIASWHYGLWVLDIKTHKLTHFVHEPDDQNSLSNDKVRSLAQGPDGSIWVGTYQGLNRFENGRFERFIHRPALRNSIALDWLTDLFVDRTGVLWIGTAGVGLNKLSPVAGSFNNLRADPMDPHSLSGPIVFSILEDRRGTLWVGTLQSGLNRRDRGTGHFQHYKADPQDPAKLPNAAIMCMVEDRHGRLWLGTQNGLAHYDREQDAFETFVDQTSVEQPLFINTMVESPDGHLWIGTNTDSVLDFDPETKVFKPFNLRYQGTDPLAGKSISDLLYQRDVGLWIASREGLALWGSEGSFHLFRNDPNQADSLVHDSINGLMLKDKALWIFTDGGASQLDTTQWQAGRFQNLTTSDGLPNQTLYGGLEDSRGRLWISTNAGLVRYEPSSQNMLVFDVGDGLQSNEFNQGAFFKSPEGRMYFGGIHGLNMFYPENLFENREPPKVVLTAFQKFNSDVPLDQPLAAISDLSLNHKDAVINFEFSALDFSNPKKNRYAYRLLGFDSRWIQLGHKREVTFTNLDAGNYSLHVKAAGSQGIWNEDGLKINLTVVPPWWRTWYAYTLFGLVSALILTGIPILRIRNLKNRKKELEGQVARRTEEIRQKAEALKLSNRELQETADQLRETQEELVEAARMAGMAEVATNVLHNVGNSLTSLNTTTSLLHEAVQKDRTLPVIEKLVNMLNKHRNDLAQFLTRDEKGCQVPDALERIQNHLHRQNTYLIDELNQVKHNVDKLQDIVQAQQEHARSQVPFEQVDLVPLLEDLLKSHQARLMRHHIDLQRIWDVRPQLLTQKPKLKHILTALLCNAIEAMEHTEGARVLTLQTKQASNEKITITVEDTGQGIPPHQLKAIFGQDYQSDKKPSPSGFGLHYCANIVQEWKGNIWAESEGKGRGARIKLELPRDPREDTF